MEKQRKPHCIILAYPSQGHINPMLQFSKRLVQKGIKVSLVSTKFFWKTITNKLTDSIALESISDGFDEEGPKAAESVDAYIKHFWKMGPQSLSELLDNLATSGSPADCVVYDSFFPWALEVAKKFGALVAPFFTQSCAVNNIYFQLHQGIIKLPLSESKITLPALPELAPSDLPSFLYAYGTYPFFRDLVVDPFNNIEKADWLLSNTVYELEQEVVDWMMKIWPLRTIGPTIPSMFLDKKLKDDEEYGIAMFNPNSDACMNWLNDKPKGSVVYVSFGSIAALNEEQMEELAWGLKDSKSYFLWVVRVDEESKLPKGFLDISKKGLIVTWCPQLQVLSHEAVGCFVTHCGWNSTLEAISLGIPMIAMPQWSDQATNAKLIMDVWKMGLKAIVDEKGIARSEAIKQCIKEIMESERGKEMKKNALKWMSLARNSVDEGGSSDKNINEFVAHLVHSV